MTIFSHIFAGSSALGVSYLVAQSLFVPPAFIEVHDMTVDAGVVHVERSYNSDGPLVADWRVTVVGEGRDDPSCQTVAGPALHQGWSVYEGPYRAIRNFHLDVWTGDPGCLERLDPGAYQMFVTWTPRNGSPPVTAYTEFSI